jgi:hypothetical protein
MAEVIGHLTLLNKALPTGVDGTRLAEWALRDGVTYGELANQVALALAQANQELVNRWGWSFSFTEDLMQEYENGGAVTAMDEMTDMDRPKPVLGTTIGHMIDLRTYGSAIGGTRHYFRDARSALINTAIRTNVRKAVWRFEQKLLTRWLTNTENAIGAAGYDVPFVRGTGGNVDFAPPAFEGEAFTTSHDHYVAENVSTPKTFADLLNTMAETLQEHGHEPPFRSVVSRADVATYAALTKFVEMVNVNGLIIDRGGESSGNQMFRMAPQWIGGHFGDFQSDYGLIELFATARLATGYAGLTKSYGNLDARNGLAVRVHPSVGFGMMIVPETTINDDTPIKQLDIEFEFGVGVGADRTNGVAGLLVAGGAWANATIS